METEKQKPLFDEDVPEDMGTLGLLVKVRALRKLLAEDGPLYVRCLVPDYAADRNDYSPWYLAHFDAEQLSDDVLLPLIEEFDEWEECESLGPLFVYLERKGYIGLNSAYYDEGVPLIVPVPDDDLEDEEDEDADEDCSPDEDDD